MVLHNIFADHTDKVIKHNHIKGSEVATAGTSCHIEAFLAEKTFIDTYTPLNINLPGVFHVFSSEYDPEFYSEHHFFPESRGPPVKA